MKEVIKWITCCDTIGDIFKNPIIMRIIAEWHMILKNGKKLTWRQKTDKKMHFTPEYYEFIREIFEDRKNMEAFLIYVRERFLTDKALYMKVQENYDQMDIIKALLSFDDINTQLSTDSKFSVKSVFEERLMNVLEVAWSTSAYDEDECDDREIDISAAKNNVIYALKNTLINEVCPISSDGEILCWVDEGNTGHMVSVLWVGIVFEVNKLGVPITESTTDQIITEVGEEVLDTREKVLTRIKLLERIIAWYFDKTETLELSKEDENFYIDESLTFKAKFRRKNKNMSEEIEEIHFWKHLVQLAADLETAFKNMWSKPEKLELIKNTNILDKTHQKTPKWTQKGIERIEQEFVWKQRT